jgi:hypothetical protein
MGLPVTREEFSLAELVEKVRASLAAAEEAERPRAAPATIEQLDRVIALGLRFLSVYGPEHPIHDEAAADDDEDV